MPETLYAGLTDEELDNVLHYHTDMEQMHRKYRNIAEREMCRRKEDAC